MSVDSVRGVLRQLLETLEEQAEHPYGPKASSETRQVAGDACVRLAGDQDRARTLWKLVVNDCGGYMPACAAKALIRASSTNFVPDVTPPEPS